MYPVVIQELIFKNHYLNKKQIHCKRNAARNVGDAKAKDKTNE
jgi:hypothetical protein